MKGRMLKPVWKDSRSLRRTHRNRRLNSPGYIPADVFNIKSPAVLVNVYSRRLAAAEVCLHG